MRGSNMRYWSSAMGIDRCPAQAPAWALLCTARGKAQASFTRRFDQWQSERHKTFLPHSKAVTSQGSKLTISITLETSQRCLRELLLRDCSYLLDLRSLTRKEHPGQHPGQLRTLCYSGTIRVQTLQFHTSWIFKPYCCCWLFNNRRVSENHCYLQLVISNLVTRKNWEEVVLKRLTGIKITSVEAYGCRLSCVLGHYILIMTSVTTVVDCNQSLYSIRTIKWFWRQKWHCSTSLKNTHPENRMLSLVLSRGTVS